MMPDDISSFASQIVKDAIKDLKATGNGYVFNKEQLNAVLIKYPNTKYKWVDNYMYKLENREVIVADDRGKHKKTKTKGSSKNTKVETTPLEA